MKRRNNYLVILVFLLSWAFLPLFAEKFTLVEEEEFSSKKDDSVTITKKSAGSAATAFEDPERVELEDDDFGKVCDVIMYVPDKTQTSSIFHPQHTLFRLTSKQYSLPMISPTVNVNIADSFNFNNSAAYVVRRYIPARRTYVYNTIWQRPPGFLHKSRHIRSLAPPKFGPRINKPAPPKFGPRVHKPAPPKLGHRIKKPAPPHRPPQGKAPSKRLFSK